MTACLAVAGDLLPAGPVDRGGTSMAGPGQGGVVHGAGEPTDAITPVGQAAQQPPDGLLDPLGQVMAGPGGHVELPFRRAGEVLQAAVTEALPGATVTDVHGWRIPADEHNPETVGAYLDLVPSAGAPAGSVSVFFRKGGSGSLSAQEYVEWCTDEVDDCQVSTLPDGTVVKSYSSVMVDTPTGPWTLYRVERLVDGVVIRLNASAGRADDEGGSVLAPHPPLTMQQLIDVAAHLQPLR